jgi:hypothetical protein
MRRLCLNREGKLRRRIFMNRNNSETISSNDEREEEIKQEIIEKPKIDNAVSSQSVYLS